MVTGQNGQVARALAGLDCVDISVLTLGRTELDITKPEAVGRAIERLRPDIVVNAAAYTAVDQAERDAEAAFAVNCDGAGYVAAAATQAGLPVIQISTDYVFSGAKREAYLEDDPVDPQGVYARSKLAGELRVAAANPRHVILRTAWVYSPWGRNFALTMLRLATLRDVVRVVDDQFGTPTYAPDIALGILAVAKRVSREPSDKVWAGTFHMTAAGSTTWAGFARAVFAASAARGGPSARVEPITTADYPTPASRPADSRLNTARFAGTFAYALPDWREGVEQFVSALSEPPPIAPKA